MIETGVSSIIWNELTEENLSCSEWMLGNLDSSFSYQDDIPWKLAFKVECWMLWWRRNEFVHNEALRMVSHVVMDVIRILFGLIFYSGREQL